MFPEFHFFGQVFHTFNLCLMPALLAVVLLAVRDCKRMRLGPAMENKVLAVIPFFVLLGIAAAVFSDWLFRKPSADSVGATFLGWLLGASTVLAAHGVLVKIGPRFLFNFFFPSFALAQAFGRVGCFLGGCCHGRPGFFGFAFPAGSRPHAAHGDCVLYPVQLMEAAWLVVVFFLCRRCVRFERRGGAYWVLMATGRFFLEFLRGDDRGSIGGQTLLSPAQVICLFLCAAGFWLANVNEPA